MGYRLQKWDGEVRGEVLDIVVWEDLSVGWHLSWDLIIRENQLSKESGLREWENKCRDSEVGRSLACFRNKKNDSLQITKLKILVRSLLSISEKYRQWITNCVHHLYFPSGKKDRRGWDIPFLWSALRWKTGFSLLPLITGLKYIESFISKCLRTKTFILRSIGSSMKY